MNLNRTMLAKVIALSLINGMMVYLSLSVTRPKTQAQGEQYRIVFPTWDFEVSESGGRKIFLVNLDGSNLMRLTDTGRGISETMPVWSPDGALIAFQSTPPDVWSYHDTYGEFPTTSNANILIADAGGGTRLQLTNSDRGDRDPQWSPDGERIAFYSRGDIYIVNVHDPDDLTLFEGNSIGYTQPQWSPDGTALLVWLIREKNSDIGVLHLADGSLVRLTDHPAIDIPASWSPDGEHIIFISDRDGNREIYRMNRDGTQKVRLTYTDVDEHLFDTAWSPDGQWIVFSRPATVFVSEHTDPGVVITSPRDGANVYLIRSDGSEEIALTEAAMVHNARWLPDASGLVLVMQVDYPDALSRYALHWLDLSCLEGATGCSPDDITRIPDTETYALQGFDISPVPIAE